MNEFHDPELERMLGRASGAYPDANVAFETVRGRVRQVRRRRAMAASTAACVLLAGVVALAVHGGDEAQVRPSDQSTPSLISVDTTTPETEVSTPSTEMAPDTTAAVTTVATMGTDSASPGGPGSSSSSGKGSAGRTSTSTSTTPATTSASQVQPTTPNVDVQWFLSKGGSAGVQLVNGRMVLVGTSPASGFTAHVTETSGDRIRVEFANGTATYELQLQLSDGTITRSVQHKGA